MADEERRLYPARIPAIESLGVRGDVTRAFPLTVRVPPRP